MPGGGDQGVPLRSPPAVPPWPVTERLSGHDVVLARPRLEDAAATLAMQADERLWVDVPPAWRVTTLEAQQDDFRRFQAHWREHGFGYWLAWGDAGTEPSVSDPSAWAEPLGVGGSVGARGLVGAGEPVGARGPVGIGGLRWLWWRGQWVLNVYVRIAVAHQGRGLATAVLAAAIDRLDDDLDAPTAVVVRTRDANAPMMAVAQRLGMVDIGHEQREMGRYRVFERHIGGPR